jgi:hypothetical protein
MSTKCEQFANGVFPDAAKNAIENHSTELTTLHSGSQVPLNDGLMGADEMRSAMGLAY